MLTNIPYGQSEVSGDMIELSQLRAMKVIYDQLIPQIPEAGLPWPPRTTTRLCTALFTDVRGFTRLAEEFADHPADLLAVLNEHFAAVTGAITRCGGIIEKFVGDGVFATFGAHDAMPDHRDRALAAALATVGTNEAVNRRKAASWGFRLDVGVGVASGSVVVGQIGTETRAEIAVLGDAVNVAARLVAQAAPGQILIGASTFRSIAGAVRGELLGMTPIRGKVHGVEIYRLDLFPVARLPHQNGNTVGDKVEWAFV